MTTIVGKGAGRPAAAARTAKHAQRNVKTGPRPAVAVAQAIHDATQSAPDSDSAMAAALNGTAYGRMKVTELRALVKGMKGAPAVSRMPKGDLLNWLLEAERAHQLMEHAAEAEAELDDDPAEPVADHAEPDAKGAAKARRLYDALAGHGWVRKSVTGDPEATDRCTAVLARGGETLTVVWHAGVYSYDMSAHMVHDRTTRLRNVSAAIKLGSRPQEAVEAEYGKVIANRRFRPAHTKSEGNASNAVPLDRRLFPNPNEISEDELFAALAGYRVVWVNRVSNMTESGTASQNSRFFSLRNNPAGEPVVQFCTEHGFRACRVADIISTSRKAGRARRTKTLAGGEEVRAA